MTPKLDLIEPSPFMEIETGHVGTLGQSDEICRISDKVRQLFIGLLVGVGGQAKPESGRELLGDFFSECTRTESGEGLRRAMGMLFDCQRDMYFSGKALISDEDLMSVISAPEVKAVFSEYIRWIISKIYTCDCDPIHEISFALYLLGIGHEYNLVRDLSEHDLRGLIRFAETKVRSLDRQPKESWVEDIELILGLVNQLSTLFSIHSKDQRVFRRVYWDLLIPKTQQAIFTFIKQVSPEHLKLAKPGISGGILFSEMLGTHISHDDFLILCRLQDILGRSILNFAGNDCNLEMHQSMERRRIMDLVDERVKMLRYGWELRERSGFGKGRSDPNPKTHEMNERIALGNIAYVELAGMEAMKGAGIRLTANDGFRQRKYVEDLIRIYSKDDENGKIYLNTQEVLDDFITDKTITYFQLIAIWMIVKFSDLEADLMAKVLEAALKKKDASSAHYEQFKIKIIETVTEKIAGNRRGKLSKTKLCERDECRKGRCRETDTVCKKLIASLERFVDAQGGNRIIYNTGKMHLYLSLLYSLGKEQASMEKALEHHSIFLHRYGDRIPKNLSSLIGRVKQNLTRAMIHRLRATGGAGILENEQRVRGQDRYQDLQEGISELILLIQRSDPATIGQGGLKPIRTQIGNLISKTIFSGCCKIHIVEKGATPGLLRFEKSETIEHDDFDIVFIFGYAQERTFRYIFGKEKDRIRSQISRLIGIYARYAEVHKLLNTVMMLTAESISKKHPYTAGHITDLRGFCKITAKMLGFGHYETQVLEAQAVMHDYGKDFIDTEVLTKVGNYSQADMAVMAEHTGRGVKAVIDNEYDEILLDGMMHHSAWHSEDGDPSLTKESLIRAYKETGRMDFTSFNRILGKNIPLASRIIGIWDVASAITSRRIYDRRAHLPIGEIIGILKSELLKGAGLILRENRLRPDMALWRLGDESDQERLCTFSHLGEWFVPKEDARILFDPHLVYELFRNEDHLKAMGTEIIEMDRVKIRERICEFEEGASDLSFKLLQFAQDVRGDLIRTGKAEVAGRIELYKIEDVHPVSIRGFMEICESLPLSGEQNESGVPKDHVFTPTDAKDLIRLLEVIPRLYEQMETYRRQLNSGH